jgi:hypothetical protein
VIDVDARAERGTKGKTKMTIFTIDNENSITAFATAEAAAAASTTPFDLFTNQKELAELLAGWPAERLVATWNSLPGVIALKSLPDTKAAKGTWAKKIWDRVEKLGQMVATEAPAAKKEATKPAAPTAKPKAAKKAAAAVQTAKGTPVKGKAGKQATPATPAPKGKKAAKQSKGAEAPKAARTGSKSEEVIAMLKRKNGATMAEIMAHTGWQKHTTRGWVSGFLGKKMGIAVESFKSDQGERTYRING